MFKAGVGKRLRAYAREHEHDEPVDARSVQSVRTINGVSHHTSHILPTSPELRQNIKRLKVNSSPNSQLPTFDSDIESLWQDSVVPRSPVRPGIPCMLDDNGGILEEEPAPDYHDHYITCPEKDQFTKLSHLAFLRLLALEAPLQAETLCASVSCAQPGEYRCEDCNGEGLYCRPCLMTMHRITPFHRPLHWNGKFFEHTTFMALGFVFGMNHGEVTCPHEERGSEQYVTVLDTNGMHEICVSWCRCANAPTRAEQLLDRRIFPANMTRPSTGFTFRVLKLFQMLNHVGRSTPWDFCGTLQRLTDNVVPSKLRDIYKQFNVVQRHWRVIRAWKRAGVVDPASPRAKGSLFMDCVSCPIPGINIPENWKENPDAELIYAIYIGGDGNMRLSRNNKGGGETKDPSLFADEAFYAPNAQYKDFSRVRGAAPDDQSDITCRGLRAGNPARVTQSHNKPCTGLIAISCIRSGAFLRNGTVDLGKGERFVNFDFALVQVLKMFMSLGIARFVISYDIACKYHIYFSQRMTNTAWPLMTPEQYALWLTLSVVWLVPKFHLAAHIEGCADNFSFNWTKNVGRTCGELVESNWSSLGHLANSTREMGFGHRRDTLNDIMGDWNWRKAINEATRISRGFRAAKLMLVRKEETLNNLERSMGHEMLTRVTIECERRGESRFRPRVLDSPSRHSVLKLIRDEEERDRHEGESRHGTATRCVRLSGSVGINMGLDIEMRQQNLRVKVAQQNNRASGNQRAELLEARRKMSKALDAWFANLADFMPGDALEEPLESEEQPERSILRLPSDFPKDSHRRLGLEEIANIEQQLRVGQAHDALKQLRMMLGLKSFLTKRKYKLAGGQTALTRSEAAIQKASRQVRKWKEIYQRAWKALERLRGHMPVPEGDLAWCQLRPLEDTDCIMLSQWVEEDRYWREQGEIREDEAVKKGKGRKELPWIWKMEVAVGNVVNGDVQKAIEGWTDEVIRLEWLHAKASRDRFNEEVRLLRAESARVGKTFHYLASIWEGRAQTLHSSHDMNKGAGVTLGAAAYAERQVHVFLRLAQEAEEQYADVLAG